MITNTVGGTEINADVPGHPWTRALCYSYASEHDSAKVHKMREDMEYLSVRSISGIRVYGV